MKIIENAVPRKFLETLTSRICDYKSTPFYLCDTTAYANATSAVDHSSWSHIVFDEQNGVISPFFHSIEAAVYFAFDKVDEQINQLLRIRIGLSTAHSKNIVRTPHIDRHKPHKTAILYLNDCDGDTIIYREKYDWQQNLNPVEYYNKIKQQGGMHIAYSSTPKANKMILFDGLHYHSSSCQTNSAARIVININYN